MIWVWLNHPLVIFLVILEGSHLPYSSLIQALEQIKNCIFEKCSKLLRNETEGLLSVLDCVSILEVHGKMPVLKYGHVVDCSLGFNTLGIQKVQLSVNFFLALEKHY